MIAFWLNVYYVVVLAWALFYLFSVVRGGWNVPWASCDHAWNTPTCRSEYVRCYTINETIQHFFNTTDVTSWHLDSFEHSVAPDNWTHCGYNYTSPVKEFWE